MSTYFATVPAIRLSDVFDGRLLPFGVREQVTEDTTESSRCLTDGNNFVWAWARDGGGVEFSRHGGNVPTKILTAVSEVFDVRIVSEHEPEYWGYDTVEEWNAAEEKAHAQHRTEFYEDVMRYVRGADHSLEPGTVGMIQAEIAKELVAADSALALQMNRDKLLEQVEAVYMRDHAITVTLADEDISAARMYATHEDDLPKA